MLGPGEGHQVAADHAVLADRFEPDQQVALAALGDQPAAVDLRQTGVALRSDGGGGRAAGQLGTAAGGDAPARLHRQVLGPVVGDVHRDLAALEVLDLSMGTMTDAGAERLLDARGFRTPDRRLRGRALLASLDASKVSVDVARLLRIRIFLLDFPIDPFGSSVIAEVLIRPPGFQQVSRRRQLVRVHRRGLLVIFSRFL